MTTNPILDGLHATRRKLLAAAGGTLEGLVADLQRRQQESGRKIIVTKRVIPSGNGGNSHETAPANPPSPAADR